MKISSINNAKTFCAKKQYQKPPISQKPPVTGIYYGEDVLNEALLQNNTLKETRILKRIPLILAKVDEYVQENCPNMTNEDKQDLIHDVILKDLEAVARYNLSEKRNLSSYLQKLEKDELKIKNRQNKQDRDMFVPLQAEIEDLNVDCEKMLTQLDLQSVLNEVLDSFFNTKNAMVIKKYYGLEGEFPHTFKQIADEMHCSGARIHERYIGALRTLKHPTNKAKLKDFSE